MYEYGVAAVEIADDYLSNKVTIEDAIKRLETNYQRQNWLVEDEKKELNVDSLYGTDYQEDSSVSSYTLLLICEMRDKKSGTGTNDKIKECRNRLAKVLWV